MNSPKCPQKVFAGFDLGSQKSSRVIPTWFNGLPESDLSVSTNTLIFDDTHVGDKSQPLLLTIYNNGFRPQQLSLSTSDQFVLSSSNVVVPKQGSISIKVWFKPDYVGDASSLLKVTNIAGSCFNIELTAAATFLIVASEDLAILDVPKFFSASYEDFVMYPKEVNHGI